jgi:hypothetical protein
LSNEVEIKLNPKFRKKVEGMFGKYQFQVGILEDKPHFLPKRGAPGKKGQDVLKRFAGGKARQQSRKDSGMTIAEVSEANRKRMRINYLTQPFKSRAKSQADILKFTTEFFKLVFGRSQQKRCENLLQAIVRNPILREEYPKESAITQKIKGFSRPLIDTAQLFKAIRARCKVVRRG